MLARSALGPVQLPHPGCFRSQLDWVGEQHASRLALQAGQRSLSYAELLAGVRRAARGLGLILGGRQHVGIGVWGEATPECVLVQLAALYTDNYYYFVDSSRTDRQLREAIGQSHISLMVDCSLVGAAIPDLGDLGPARVSYADLLGGAGDVHCPIHHEAHEAGALFFTSGTTGRSKAVLFPVRCLMQDIARQTYTMQVSSGDRIDLLFSLGFSASLACIHAALLNGASLWMANLRQLGVGQLFAWLKANAITISTMGPNTLRAMLSSLAPDARFEHLRFLCSGGDVLFREDVRTLLAHCPEHCVMQNAYASTEARTMTEFLIHRDTVIPTEKVSLGWPVEGKEIRLLPTAPDGQGHPAPGEIVVLSQFIPGGYFTGETRGAFQVDTQSGSVCYRTGDLGYLDDTGALHFAGRKDDQVKVRGFRIQPVEVESALNRHPGVRQAVVVGRADSLGAQELVAFFVPAGTPPPTLELRRHLSESLPYYMVPGWFVPLDSLPLNANGKLDRLALAAREFQRGHASPPGAEPRTATEQTLAGLWCQVLRLEAVGIHDSFFDLGGDSLLVVQLQLRIQERFARAISVSELVGRPTIAQLAATLAEPAGLAPGRSGARLRGATAGTPLFYVPGADGVGFLPEPLAAPIGRVCPYYDLLRYPGVASGETACTCLEELAAALAAQIGAVWPEGPLCLCGYSFGGVVAFEIARQMRRAGRNVAGLVLWDSFAPRPLQRRSWREALAVLRAQSTTLPPRERRQFLHGLLRGKARHLAARRFRLPVSSSPDASGPGTAVRGSLASPVATASAHMFGRYRPQPYDGRAILFQASDRALMHGVFYRPDPLNDWGGLFSAGLEVRSVPGNHDSLMHEPHARDLAEQTLAYLEQA